MAIACRGLVGVFTLIALFPSRSLRIFNYLAFYGALALLVFLQVTGGIFTAQPNTAVYELVKGAPVFLLLVVLGAFAAGEAKRKYRLCIIMILLTMILIFVLVYVFG